MKGKSKSKKQKLKIKNKTRYTSLASGTPARWRIFNF